MKKRKGIVLVASINAFHGNVLPDSFEKIHTEELGLSVLENSGLKMTINCHQLDLLMYPWLGKYQNSNNLKFSGGLFSHVLPALTSVEHLEWQEENGIINPTVSFYPEFCSPKKPTRNFWLLDSQTHYYSSCGSSEEVVWNAEEVGALPSTIKVNGQFGFVMKERLFKPILDLMFLSQRFPDAKNAEGVSNLDHLVQAIADLEEVVLVPFDLEAPYVGSMLGKNFWERLIEKIKENNLEDRFLDFEEVHQSLIEDATTLSDTPHRNLGKWTSVEATYDYFADLKVYSKRKLSEKEHLLLAFAASADPAAAIFQKSLYSRKPINLTLVDLFGNNASVKITGNSEIIKVGYIARGVFLTKMKKEEGAEALKLWRELSKKQKCGIFWKQLISVTKQLDI
ncbi:MAG: hypothetical protein ACOYMB_03990 [Patescibacteria group bacterium]